MIYLYLLKQESRARYIGLTINPQKRKNDHRGKRPPHEFVILETYQDPVTASNRERELIEEFNTMIPNGWNLSPGGEYDTASGYSRKGIGGAKKGRVPWNKGKRGCFSEETISKMSEKRKGRAHTERFLHIVPEILKRFENHSKIEGVGERGPNGLILTQERAFAKLYAKEYGMSVANLRNIVAGKTWSSKNQTADMKS